MSTRDLLERWRPSAAPGAPSAAGVPADRVAERSAELEPVLGLLADVQAEVDRIRSDTVAEAARRRAAAHEQSRALIREAQRQAHAERSAAAAAAQAAGKESATRILAQAHRDSRSIAERSQARESTLVEQVLGQARDEIAALVEATS